MKLFVITCFLLLLTFPLVSFADKTKEYDPHLLADVQYLISANETIDYDDPKLWEILNKRDYVLFQVYKGFIEFDKSEKTPHDIKKAREVLVRFADDENLANRMMKITDANEIYSSFCSYVSFKQIGDDIVRDLPEDLEHSWDNGYEYIKIPLWLMMKNRNIISSPSISKLTVKSNYSLRDVKEYIDFLSSMAQIHPGYLYPMHGGQPFNSYIVSKYFTEQFSYHPSDFIVDDCYGLSLPERFQFLEKWAGYDPQNIQKYQELMQAYNKLIPKLNEYWRNNYDLGKFDGQAEEILSSFICEYSLRKIDELPSVHIGKTHITYDPELLADVQYLLSDKETIDYDDPRLDEILNKYDYQLFQVYKAFIEFDKSEKTPEDIKKGRQVLAKFAFDKVTAYRINRITDPEKLYDKFFSELISDSLGYKLKDRLKKDPRVEGNNIYKVLAPPKWLMLKKKRHYLVIF